LKDGYSALFKPVPLSGSVIRKISGGHRGASTATAGTIITSVLRTARQQGRHLIKTVQHLVQSHLAGRPTDLLTSTSGMAGGKQLPNGIHF